VAALVLNGAIAGAEIIVFTLVRRYFPLVYEPRSLSNSKACAYPLVLPVPYAYFHVGNDSSDYLPASWDG
jgi:hypothetical protein